MLFVIGIVSFGDVSFGGVSHNSVPFGSVLFGGVPFWDVLFGSVLFGGVPFWDVLFGGMLSLGVVLVMFRGMLKQLQHHPDWGEFTRRLLTDGVKPARFGVVQTAARSTFLHTHTQSHTNMQTAYGWCQASQVWRCTDGCILCISPHKHSQSHTDSQRHIIISAYPQT